MANEFLIDLQRGLRSLDARFGTSSAHRSATLSLMNAWEVPFPEIEDVTELIGCRNGAIHAIRWDKSCGTVGFKLPVMISLLVYHLLRSTTKVETLQGIIDGGNVNTALALGFLGRKLELPVEHVLSRHFPEDVRNYVLQKAGSFLSLRIAPQSDCGKEVEFYSHLIALMRARPTRGRRLCLWHAKYGGRAIEWMGRLVAERLAVPPDDVVLGLGSGATLEGVAIPIKEKFRMAPRIVVAEHVKSRLVTWVPRVLELFGATTDDSARFRVPPSSIPHSVIGPHYDDINPLLRKNHLDQVDRVAVFDDSAWQRMATLCLKKGLGVGNSSAANLAVSAELASKGRSVVTCIYEPLRSFYLENAREEGASGRMWSIDDRTGEVQAAESGGREGTCRAAVFQEPTVL
jgi:cysteine synthase